MCVCVYIYIFSVEEKVYGAPTISVHKIMFNSFYTMEVRRHR